MLYEEKKSKTNQKMKDHALKVIFFFLSDWGPGARQSKSNILLLSQCIHSHIHQCY